MVDQLSMKIQIGGQPFALTDDEALFRPDDWAWQFLRLNRHYVKDYAKAKSLGLIRRKSDRHFCDADGGCESSYPRRPDVTYQDIIENEKYCRTQYGLSTWLNPKNTVLPKFSEEKDETCSWFFPLRIVTTSNLTLSKSLVKGIFGYFERPPHLTKSEHASRSSWGDTEDEEPCSAVSKQSSVVRFTVRIDRPVFSQMSTIEHLATRYRDILKKTPKQVVRPATDIDKFLSSKRIKLTYPGRAGCRTVGIEIDIFGPLQKQMEHYQVALATFLNDRLDNSSTTNRFSLPGRVEKQFRTSRNGPAVILTDGNTYKQKIIVRQLSNMGLTSSEIVDLIRWHADLRRPVADPQLEHYDKFQDRINESLVDAKNFVNGAYRWFVYAGKSPVNNDWPVTQKAGP